MLQCISPSLKLSFHFLCMWVHGTDTEDVLYVHAGEAPWSPPIETRLSFPAGRPHLSKSLHEDSSTPGVHHCSWHIKFLYRRTTAVYTSANSSDWKWSKTYCDFQRTTWIKIKYRTFRFNTFNESFVHSLGWQTGVFGIQMTRTHSNPQHQCVIQLAEFKACKQTLGMEATPSMARCLGISLSRF